MKDAVPESHSAAFAPQLYMEDVSTAIQFYKNAFGAIELRRFNNPDGSVHVAEMSIPPALFRLHQEVSGDKKYIYDFPVNIS
jgi:uncharacterized glyoxalase superfamily protein PhnB